MLGVREAVFTEVPAIEPSPAPTDVAFDFRVFLALAPAFWTEKWVLSSIVARALSSKGS